MPHHLTVIICTHNPREDYLRRVLDSLRQQTMPCEIWELLLIDNASDSSLSKTIDLSWHPNSRCVPEAKLGLTNARIRGISEATSDVFIFVDDDNILDLNYLEVALKISDNYPLIGAWGGQISGDFEIEPPQWVEPYLPCLGIRSFEKPSWSNLLHQHETTPCGVGMCVRRNVAEKYVEMVQTDPKRLALGRIGNKLTSCEDTDLAFTACDIGLGTGQFPELHVTHIIPSSRLQEEYIVLLLEGMAYSNIILDSFRNKFTKLSWKSLLRNWYTQLKNHSKESRHIHKATQRGLRSALQELRQTATQS